MQIFSQVLTDTDALVRLSFPRHCLQYLDFKGILYISPHVDLEVEDCNGRLHVIRCLNIVYEDPVLSKGWRQFVKYFRLRVGDVVVLHREDDQILGPQFRIEAKRSIKLCGEEVWGEVTGAN